MTIGDQRPDAPTPTWETIMRRAIDARLLETFVSLPAQVVSYDAQTRTCSVQPSLQEVFLDDDDREAAPEDAPQIDRCPIHYPTGGGFSFIFPLRPGDRVALICADRSLDRWLESLAGQRIDPADGRFHALTDAWVAPGLFTRRDQWPPGQVSDLVIVHESGSEFRFTPDGKLSLGDPAALRGLARLDDSTLVDAGTDSAFVTWMAAVDAAIRALSGVPGGGAIASAYSAAVSAAPTTAAGKISTASEDVSGS